MYLRSNKIRMSDPIFTKKLERKLGRPLTDEELEMGEIRISKHTQTEPWMAEFLQFEADGSIWLRIPHFLFPTDLIPDEAKVRLYKTKGKWTNVKPKRRTLKKSEIQASLETDDLLIQELEYYQRLLASPSPDSYEKLEDTLNQPSRTLRK